jgi:cyclin D3
VVSLFCNQVDLSRYVFEAKTIKRMEILVLSTLQWKMNPVTPLSFLDYITRRLGLKDHLCWEFLRRCEHILLSVLSGKPSNPNISIIAIIIYFHCITTCNTKRKPQIVELFFFTLNPQLQIPG